jgi:hypothetical protein
MKTMFYNLVTALIHINAKECSYHLHSFAKHQAPEEGKTILKQAGAEQCKDQVKLGYLACPLKPIVSSWSLGNCPIDIRSSWQLASGIE